MRSLIRLLLPIFFTSLFLVGFWLLLDVPTSAALLEPSTSVSLPASDDALLAQADVAGRVEQAASAMSPLMAPNDLTPATQEGRAAANTVKTYQLTLRNNGGLSDTITLTTTSSQGWTVAVSPPTKTLASGAAISVTLTLTVPSGTAGLIDTSVITATSDDNPAVQSSAQVTTQVGGVSLEPDNTQAVAPNSVYTYTHTLTNTGATTDTFALSLSSTQGWGTLVTSPPLTLAAGTTTTVQVRVTVPDNASGQTDTTTVTATSSNLGAISDTAQDVTEVRGVSLEPDQTAAVAANSVYTYTHTLTNTGALADTFDLTSASSEGWTTSVTPSSVPLGAGASTTVQVRVEIPVDAAGDIDITTVTATSSNIAAVTETASDTTSVRGVSLAPDNSADVAPLSVYTYTHTLTNTGALADTFDLTSVSSQGWTTSVTPNSVPLGAGASTTVQVRVEIPADAAGDIDITTVTATSSNIAAVTETANDTTSVRGVSLEPDNSQTVLPDTVFTYTHTLTNTGALPDVFNLEINSSEGWATLEAGVSSVSLAVGATATIKVRVTVPSGAAGLSDTTVITATSTNLATVFDIATDITSVAGVSFAPNRAQSVDPGTSYTYTHTLTNTGALEDSFSFTSSNTHGWAIAITPSSPVTLSPNATSTIQVRVTVPLSTAAGLANTTIVTATSGLIANLTGSVQDVTTVNAIAGTRHTAVSGTNTDNSCLASSYPCLSLTYAVSQALADDTIKLAAGTYTNTTAPMATVSQNLTIIGGYTSGNWTTSNPSSNVTILDGEGKGRVVESTLSGVTLNLSGLTIQRGTIGVYMQNAQLVMTNSIVISSTVTSSSSGAVYLSNSDNAKIESSRIKSNNGQGVFLQNSDNVSLMNNTITDNGQHGVRLHSSNNNITITGNSFTNQISDGVLIVANNNNGILKGNTIRNNGSYGIDFFQDSNSNWSVTGNTIADHSSNDGAYIKGGSNHVWDNNIIVDNGADGIQFDVGSNITLRHNTIAGNSSAGLRLGSGTFHLTNTIIANHSIGIVTTSSSGNVFLYSTLWHGNTLKTSLTTDSKLSQSNSQDGNPSFVGGSNPFNGYHIQADSLAIDAGTSSGVTTDIDGQGRAYPDIGADEFAYVLKLTPTSQRKTSNPNTVISHTHTLRNSGGLTTTVSLTKSSSQAWSALSPPNVTLGSGQAISVTLTVTVPTGTSGQFDTTVITATSVNSPTIVASAEDITLVDVGVKLEPDFVETIAAGLTATYTHAITNIGSASDSFALTLSSSKGWATLLTPSPITLGAGISGSVKVQVTIPLTAVAGIVDQAVLTATSTSISQALDTAQDMTTASAGSGTRYVAINGSDSDNSCLLSAQPCRTINYAVTTSLSGEEIKISKGTYTNTNIISEGQLLDINKELTLSGGYSTSNWNISNPTSNPTSLDGQNLGRVLNLQPASFITLTINGLTLQNSKSEGVYVQGGGLLMSNSSVISNTSDGIYLDQSPNSTISNSNISNNGSYGIYLHQNNHNVTLSGNTINQNSSYGVYLHNSNSSFVISNNTINDNDITGLYLNQSNHNALITNNNINSNKTHGIHLESSNDYISITNNIMMSNTLDGIVINKGNDDGLLAQNTVSNNNRYGIIFADTVSPNHRWNVTHNTIANNSSHGLEMRSGNTYLLDNNLFVKNGEYGLWLNRGSSTLHHNTIADNQGAAGVLVGNVTLVLSNNIIANHTTGIQTSHASANVQADSTLWYGNNSNSDTTAGGSLTLTNEQTGDPVFAGGSDPFYAYHIGSTSAAIDAGVDAGVTDDIDGNSRPLVSGYDIGADEYTGIVQAPSAVTISGITNGVIQNSYTFTATVSPLSATVPLTYVWQVTGESPVTQTNKLTDDLLLTWNSAETKAISVTVFNEAGSVSSNNYNINLSVPPAASFPFSDDFESASLASGWTTIMTNQGRVQVSNQYPYSGTYGVLLDDSTQDSTFSTAALILTLNLSAQSDAIMEFWWREFNDDNHAQDGVFISNDYGTTWHQVLSFNDGANSYTQEFIDLGAQASANGISFNDHFQIKFEFYDNEPITGDGYAIDAIKITSPQAITQATISGDSAGLINNSYPFTATLTPADATGPVTYTWEATDFSAVEQTGALEDSISFTWSSTGSKTITVTAENTLNRVSDTHTIVITAEPDLEISTFEAPSSAYAGYTIPITYTVQNTGTGGTIATSWNDRVYLSTDNTLDTGTDTLLGTISHSGALAAGANYSNTSSVELPEDIVGNYYLFLVTDADSQVNEPNGENNNSSFVPIHFALTISPSANGDDMVLSWLDISTDTPTVAEYQIWRSTEPYFTPGDAGSNELATLTAPSTGYTDTTVAISDTATNHYYVIRAVDSGGALLEDSNAVGEFDYALTLGRYNAIALPFTDLSDAASLATYINDQISASVSQVLKWDASLGSNGAYRIYEPGNPFSENFSTATGEPYFVFLNSLGSDSFALLGSVPAVASISFDLIGSTSGCRYNHISLPLDQDTIVNAGGLATAIGDISQVLSWDAALGTQGAYRIYEPGNPFSENFTTSIGHAYFACMQSGKSWP